jgi:hypothetical protein
VCGCVESDENWGEDERDGLGKRMKAMKKKGGDGRKKSQMESSGGSEDDCQQTKEVYMLKEEKGRGRK